MINVSTAYNNILSAGGHIEWRLANTDNPLIPSGTPIIQDNLIDGTLKRTLYESASIGNVMARQLDFTFYKTVTLDTSKPLKLQFRAVGSTNSAWYNMGEYWIDSLDTSAYTDKAKVIAFDALLKGNVTYLESGTWITKSDYVIIAGTETGGVSNNDGIIHDLGVTLEASTKTLLQNNAVAITQVPNIGLNGTTTLQMLSYIAIIHGGNFFINDNNELQFLPLFIEKAPGWASCTLGDAVTDFDASDGETITGICLIVDDNSYYRYPDVSDSAWEALGGRKITVKLPVMASPVLAQSLYTSLGGKTYYPYTAPKAWVDPKYQLGDGITIHTANPVSSVICNQTITLDALAASSLEADSQKQVNSSYPYVDPTERQILQNETKTKASISILDDKISANASEVELVNERIDGQTSWVRWDGATSTVEIGASDAPTQAQITPDGFAVVQDGEKILKAEGRKVTTTHFQADDIAIGRYQWIDEGTGGFSLMFIQ